MLKHCGATNAKSPMSIKKKKKKIQWPRARMKDTRSTCPVAKTTVLALLLQT